MPDERCVHIAAITTVRHAKRRECEECVKMGARWVHLRTCQECGTTQDRKSTRLNSSHSQISYAVFCLKKKHLRAVGRQRPENARRFSIERAPGNDRCAAGSCVRAREKPACPATETIHLHDGDVDVRP